MTFAVLFIMLTGFCFAADPAEGYWLSKDENTNKVTGGWHIYQENGKLQGMMLSVSTFKEGVIASNCNESYKGFPVSGKVNQMPVAGTPWIFGLTMKKPGEWSSGSVINPEDGKLYACEMIFHPAGSRKFTTDTLEMKGKFLFISRSQFWERTDRATASSLWPK